MLADWSGWLRKSGADADDRKRFEKSVAESKRELGQIIENWSTS
jgi:hypothetical protein